jgi:hypothetical protein
MLGSWACEHEVQGLSHAYTLFSLDLNCSCWASFLEYACLDALAALHFACLCAQVRDEDVFKCLDNMVKNFLVSIPLVADLRSPAMQPRHWQQLMDTTKVGAADRRGVSCMQRHTCAHVCLAWCTRHECARVLC